jgi:hypothetical protein
MFLDLINERKEARTANSRLQQWGLTWLNQVQCFYQHLCLVDREELLLCGRDRSETCLAGRQVAHCTKSQNLYRQLKTKNDKDNSI